MGNLCCCCKEPLTLPMKRPISTPPVKPPQKTPPKSPKETPPKSPQKTPPKSPQKTPPKSRSPSEPSSPEHRPKKSINDQEFPAHSHSYEWLPSLVSWFVQDRNLSPQLPILLECSNCNKIFSKAGGLCKTCKSIVCENCCPTQKTVLFCRRKHPLDWAVDSYASNIEAGLAKSSLFSCNVCRNSYQEPAYVCRSCSYYMCITCARKRGLAPPIDLLLCPDSHPLILKPIDNLKGPCRLCNAEVSTSKTKKLYQCTECDYAICHSCGILRTLSMVKHPGLRCKESHMTMALNNFEIMKNSHIFRCLGCYAGMKYGMMCQMCSRAFCLKCARELQKCIEEGVGKIGKEEKKVVWYGMTNFEEREVYECSMCDKDREKMGIYFYDEGGKEKYCMECVLSFN